MGAKKNPGRASRPQHRFRCPHCGTEGWFDPGATHVLDPRKDHDRPDGRRCRAAETSAPRERIAWRVSAGGGGASASEERRQRSSTEERRLNKVYDDIMEAHRAVERAMLTCKTIWRETPNELVKKHVLEAQVQLHKCSLGKAVEAIEEARERAEQASRW